MPVYDPDDNFALAVEMERTPSPFISAKEPDADEAVLRGAGLRLRSGFRTAVAVTGLAAATLGPLDQVIAAEEAAEAARAEFRANSFVKPVAAREPRARYNPAHEPKDEPALTAYISL